MLKENNRFKLINKKQILNIAAIFVLIYFVFHSIYGSKGILAYFKLQAELDRAHQKLKILRAERLEIENQTKLLRNESLDKDMLDEKIRSVLGLSHPGEQVFINTPQNNSQE
jgi:cell division protein FtsB